MNTSGDSAGLLQTK